MDALRDDLERRIDEVLAEDGVGADATIAFLGIGEEAVDADVVAGGEAVVCGLDVAAIVFGRVDGRIVFESTRRDGDRVAAGDVVARVHGPARSVLGAERAALNFVQRLSGIATLTARFVERVAGTGVTILDTRKTTPLWRDLEKYAVRCGGGQNHRLALSAAVLIKENHVRAVGRGDLGARLAQGRKRRRDAFVELEVDSLGLLEEVAGAPVDRIMFDNFSPDEVREGVRVLRAADRRVEIEVSGGITLDTVADYALPGVDFISVGALTHSAPATPVSLEVHG